MCLFSLCGGVYSLISQSRKEEKIIERNKDLFRRKDRKNYKPMLGRKWVTTGMRTQVLQQWFSSSRNSKMAERSVRMRNFFDADPVFPGTQYKKRERELSNIIYNYCNNVFISNAKLFIIQIKRTKTPSFIETVRESRSSRTLTKKDCNFNNETKCGIHLDLLLILFIFF